MRAFAYTSPEDYGSAAKVLRDSPTALPKAGGTDLLDLLKERILEPPRLVNLLAWFDNEWGFANRMLDVTDHYLRVAHRP